MPARTMSALSLLALSCSTETAFRETPNVGPEVSIQFPEDLDAFDENDSIEFRGLVADGNGLNASSR